MKNITIRDLYAGKPDAKDEINFEGIDNFIKTYVIAEHFNLDSLIKGTNCFITGFKGTGKTALLFYLDNKIRMEDPSTYASFVFFKEEFTDIKKEELQKISHRVLSSISVESDALMHTTEFEYVWRWVMLKRIVADNEYCCRNLFVDDAAYQRFEQIVGRIKAPRNISKFFLGNKIKFSMPVRNLQTNTEYAPEIEVDFTRQKDKQFQDFITVIDEAEQQMRELTRTDIPYYIFIDELEAYYGDTDVFKRDLYMIRDLIFTVKRFNSVFASCDMKSTKIICSVRSEILTAISRFIITKELNKVVSGFSVPLTWSYTNDNSYAHPIIQILLKRIRVCSESEESDHKLYKRWFPDTMYGIEPASYILNNSWSKPRDMVRLISTAQSSLHNNSTAFKKSVFDALTKSYSEESLHEIKEELRALYTSEEIDCIISCFTGFRTSFSFDDLQTRIKKYYTNTVLDTNTVQVLNDLYRLGFVGNYLPISKAYHWQHRGDGNLILSDEWRIIIHYALHGALALGSRINYGQTRGTPPQTGDVAVATVTKVIGNGALVKFDFNDGYYVGFIDRQEFYPRLNIKYTTSLVGLVTVGSQYNVTVTSYNENHKKWILKLVD